MAGLMRGLLIAVLVLGCGSSVPAGPEADAAIVGADAGVERATPRDRPMACGGRVASTGTGPDGPLAASYVYVERCDGDCQSLSVTIADGTTTASQSLTVLIRGGATGTYLGMQTASVVVQRGGQSTWTTLSGTVDVTVAEPPMLPTSLGAPPFGTVTGTFTIQGGGVDLSATFSSPVCGSRLAV